MSSRTSVQSKNPEYQPKALKMPDMKYRWADGRDKWIKGTLGKENRETLPRRLLSAQLMQPSHGLDVCGLY